jgi:hypothetical protein
MSNHKRISQSRPVGGFRRVSLRVDNVENTLVIEQGEVDSLTLTGDADTLGQIRTQVVDGRLEIRLAGGWMAVLRHGLRTSLTRARVEHQLTVRHLDELEVCGLARVELDRLETDRLAVAFRGAGTLHLGELTARELEIRIHGSSRIEVAGTVDTQRVEARLGTYHAPRLKSQRAQVRLQGMAQAVVWAVDALQATIRGPGSVRYLGTPRVSRQVSPVGSVAPWRGG